MEWFVEESERECEMRERGIRMKKTVYRQVGTILCLAMVIVLFAGCGGEYSEQMGTSGASGGAVSASAVNGEAVSGSGGASRYTYCSDWNLYYVRDSYMPDASIVERNLENGSEREIPVDGLHEVCYVDNDWVYYAKRIEVEGNENFDSTTIVGEVWRAPIDKSSCAMDEKAEELVLKEGNRPGMVLSRSHIGIDHKGILCDGRYIVFEGGEWTGPEGVQSLEVFLRVYDIQAGSYVHEEIFQESYCYYDIDDTVLCGDSVFAWNEEADELVRVKLETGERTTVAPFDNFKLYEEMPSSISTTSEEDIFWVNSNDDGKKEEVWQYNLAEQKSFCLITDEEFREQLGEKGLLDCSIGEKEHVFDCGGCFVRANRLYVQLEITGEGSDDEECQNRVIFSKQLGEPDANLIYEEPLNECLANPESRQKIFTKKYEGIYGRQPYTRKMYFKCRGFCVSMTEDECLMYLENEEEKKNMPACFDFRTGRLHFLEKDEEWLSKNLHAVNNGILTGDSGEFFESYMICDMMPNNYDVDEE